MRVSEYRGLIRTLSEAYASFRSALPCERATEARVVKAAARRLMAATCPRADAADRANAERLIDATASALGEAGLAGKEEGGATGSPVDAEERLREHVRAFVASHGPWAALWLVTQELREPFLEMAKRER